MKMTPEIDLLVANYSGKTWNATTQTSFMSNLVKDARFEGTGSPTDMAFCARDRINRGPKALGFIDLKPTIQLTESGKLFIEGELAEEALLRQLLKFQLPSPFHVESASNDIFCVKPYLEMFRLIYTLKKVTFDEMHIFGMQLTNYTKFDEIVQKIQLFREEKKRNKGNYKSFLKATLLKEVSSIYEEEISRGNTRTRESRDKSIENFIKTKARNMRDYTDACFRYLRATGLVSISQKGHSLEIIPEKKEEVVFFLDNIDRKPCFVDNEERYKEYLFNASLPILYTDNRDNLEKEILKYKCSADYETLKTKTIESLKKELKAIVLERKETILRNEVEVIKKYKVYEDILAVFGEIKSNNYYDTPLMLEWNAWRAMTMLDGGIIKANLKFDDNGHPMSIASGNMADIVCDYGSFALSVEVTMQSGQRQYETEGEPVSRHLAKIKKEQNKEAYCFFIAPTINDSCIAHFYILHRTNIAFYGGKSVIIPLELAVFEKMVEQSGKASLTPSPEMIKRFCMFSMSTAETASDEIEWYNAIKKKALNWLTA